MQNDFWLQNYLVIFLKILFHGTKYFQLKFLTNSKLPLNNNSEGQSCKHISMPTPQQFFGFICMLDSRSRSPTAMQSGFCQTPFRKPRSEKGVLIHQGWMVVQILLHQWFMSLLVCSHNCHFSTDLRIIELLQLSHQLQFSLSTTMVTSSDKVVG